MPSSTTSPTSPLRRSIHSRRSDESYASHSTAPTSVGSRPALAIRPCYISYDAGSPSNARASSETYASTNASIEELFEEPEEYDQDDIPYHAPQPKPDYTGTESRASTPQDFASFFPSQRRLRIRHDETTRDGNMNLRVDTEVVDRDTSRKAHVQLFHLRMHDLKTRNFSLRRYSRDSGREICHSNRKYAKPLSARPGIQRSLSNALNGLLSKPDIKRTASSDFPPAPSRKDSGYATNEDEEDSDVDGHDFASPATGPTSPLPKATNTTKLEFSNYAQVDVTRRGGAPSKRYEFEYWGSTYAWKRVAQKDAAASYHLLKDHGRVPVAHIVPELLSPAQMAAEELAGGWVPPCSMWISDAGVLAALTDVADVIIATGLLALTDDCIKRHFSPPKKPTFARQISLPLSPLRIDIEFAGPKALGGMFRRRNSADRDGQSGAPQQQQQVTRKSPLRYAKPAGQW